MKMSDEKIRQEKVLQHIFKIVNKIQEFLLFEEDIRRNVCLGDKQTYLNSNLFNNDEPNQR